MQNYLIFLKHHGKLILFVLFSLLSLYSTYLYLTIGQRGFDKVLISLSTQFVNGHITLPIYNLPIRDISAYYNNFYVYFGPLSSILLVPFAFFFKDAFPQVTIGIGSMIASFIAVYFISKKFKFSSLDSLWLSLFFVFSTVLFSSSVINITAYQVEALGVPFTLFAIWAYFSKKNSLLIGLFLGLATMTRITLMLSVIFFFFELLQKRFSIKQFLLMLIPIIIALSLLGAYNNRRFHSIFETGYNYNISIRDLPIGANLKYGDKSIMHVPANLYSLLVMSPEPLLKNHDGGFILKFPYIKLSPWGVAIWFTSPLFLLLLCRFKKNTYTISAGLASIALAAPVLLWYSIGYAQVGYRYALDFLPYIFLLLIPSLLPKLSKIAIILIIIGVIFNCIYTDSIWEIYPLFNIYP
jgi:hypothetical protein